MTQPDVLMLGEIGVLMGGCSSEREISFKSGKAIVAALTEAGCRVKAVEINSTDETALSELLRAEKIDLAFIALHGQFGEDGTLQTLLERLGIPYTGSDAQASRLAMDKVRTQNAVAAQGVRVPPYRVLSADNHSHWTAVINELGGLPVVVKPSSEGSSIGVTIVREPEMLAKAVEEAFRFGPEILLDKYIEGQELTCGILDGQALPLVEIRPKKAFFDYEAKYQKGMSEYIVPAEVSAQDTQKIQATALKVNQILGCRDFVRMDFILGKDGREYFLEANTIPGFTATSLLPMAARQAGYSFAELCLTIARLGMKKRPTAPRACCS